MISARRSRNLRRCLRNPLPPPPAHRLWLAAAHRAQSGRSRGPDRGDILAHLPRPRALRPIARIRGMGPHDRNPRSSRLAPHAATGDRVARWMSRRQPQAIRQSRPRFAAKPLTAFSRLAAQTAHRGRSRGGRGTAAQRNCRGTRHLGRGRQGARLSRACACFRRDLQQQGITP